MKSEMLPEQLISDKIKALEANIKNKAIPQFIYDLKHKLPHSNLWTIQLNWNTLGGNKSMEIPCKELYDFLANAILALSNTKDHENYNLALKLAGEMETTQNRIKSLEKTIMLNWWPSELLKLLKAEYQSQLHRLNQYISEFAKL